ncbi:hypothetical protein BR93DRAFT_924443 [Coniochaeta sp. PMI_546]|nr:hypothetical protein BR93DRAFT_924443 [Coniochaeta sp. PMI_546]
MPRYPEKLHVRSASWTGPDLSYRPPTPYPNMDFKSRFPSFDMHSTRIRTPRARYSHVDAGRYKYDDAVQRSIDAQNARIARRPRQARYYDPAERHASKRVRFTLPKRVRFDMPTQRKNTDEQDALAWEFAKLSIRESDRGPDRGRCSRCGQRL